MTRQHLIRMIQYQLYELHKGPDPVARFAAVVLLHRFATELNKILGDQYEAHITSLELTACPCGSGNYGEVAIDRNGATIGMVCVECEAGRRAEALCECGSNLLRRPVYDARAIFLTFVCDDCEAEELSKFRPEVLTDPDYDQIGGSE